METVLVTYSQCSKHSGEYKVHSGRYGRIAAHATVFAAAVLSAMIGIAVLKSTSAGIFMKGESMSTVITPPPASVA